MFDNTTSSGMVGRTPFSEEDMRVDDFYRSINRNFGELAVRQAADEMRRDYQVNFVDLLAKIRPPKILLWLSTRTPDYADDYEDIPVGVFSAFPQLVNRRMVEELKTFSDEYVECISQSGLPQSLWPGSRSIKGAVSRNGMLENRYYPTPEIHKEVAEALEEPCRRFTGKYVIKPRQPHSTFVVVGAERTGTNLLIGMLNQYPGCYCGGELFNSSQIAKGRIPWKYLEEPDVQRMIALRETDPPRFWHELCASSQKSGITATGFKLLYRHGLANEAILNELVANEELNIIHLVRRNQLHRYVSERQARAAQKWAVGAAECVPEMATIEISGTDFAKAFQESARFRDEYDSLFSLHRRFTVVYEDLSERPEAMARKVAEFLGFDSTARNVRPTFRKTGSGRVSESIAGYETLRASFRLWSSYFE